MSILSQSEFVAAWTAKLHAAANLHPAVAFDGTVSLPTWLVESARTQADRVFLELSSTPVERRDLAWADQFIRE